MIQFKAYTIRRLYVSDAEELNKLIIGNKERLKTYFPKTLKENLSIEDSKKFTLKKVEQFKTKKEFLFVITKNNVNQILGLIYIKDLNWDKSQGEFAYCIDADFQGKGLICIAVKKLSVYAFNKIRIRNTSNYCL